MTQELLSTSAPAGLHPGTSGFCTVMQSRDLPQPTAELLETLSGYRPVFLPGDPREAENPPALSHVRLNSRGRPVSVLSRVAATDRDYTGRSNRVAHHVVLDGGDARPPAGPGWLATAPGFLERTWDGQVRWLPTGRAVPPGDAPGGCPTWQRLTGDPGWAAVLADAMMKGKPFYLVYDLGMDVAALIAEALGRVPPDRRWDVTFTTYYTGLPSGVRCDIRAVLRGTAEERSAPATARLDVASLRGRPAPAVTVPAAPPPMRTPSRVAAVAAQAPVTAAPEPVVVQEQAPQVVVEDQLREEFGLKPARSPKKGGSGGLALLVTMTLLVVVASGIGLWLLFNEGGKPDPHAGTKDNGKDPPKEAIAKEGEIKKEGGPKDVTEKSAPSGKKALKLALKTRQEKVQIGDDVEFLLELKDDKDSPIVPSAFKIEKVYISRKGTKAADRTPAEEKDGVLVWRYKAKKVGKEEFVAEYDGGEKYDKAQAATTVEVEKRLVKLDLNLPTGTVFVGQPVKVSASTSNADFQEWKALRINDQEGKSISIDPKKTGSFTVTLAKGETAEWRWEEVQKTLTVKAKALPVLTLTKPNPRDVLRGVLEFMVEVKLDGKAFNQGTVQVYDGEKALLPKPEPLSAAGTAKINILKETNIAPGENKKFTVKLTPEAKVADKVDQAEAKTDEYTVSKIDVAFFELHLKLKPPAFTGQPWVLLRAGEISLKKTIPNPRVVEATGEDRKNWVREKKGSNSFRLILAEKHVVTLSSEATGLSCLVLAGEINPFLARDKEWVAKRLKPALERTEFWVYSGNKKGKDDEPVLIVKFQVTVTEEK